MRNSECEMRNGTAAVVAQDARLTTPHSAFRIPH